MKVMSFFSIRMQTRSPMTPPTTARMMSVTVLSTSSTGGGAEQGGKNRVRPQHKVQNWQPRLQASDPLRSTKTEEAGTQLSTLWGLFLSAFPVPLPMPSHIIHFSQCLLTHRLGNKPEGDPQLLPLSHKLTPQLSSLLPLPSPSDHLPSHPPSKAFPGHPVSPPGSPYCFIS